MSDDRKEAVSKPETAHKRVTTGLQDEEAEYRAWLGSAEYRHDAASVARHEQRERRRPENDPDYPAAVEKYRAWFAASDHPLHVMLQKDPAWLQRVAQRYAHEYIRDRRYARSEKGRAAAKRYRSKPEVKDRDRARQRDRRDYMREYMRRYRSEKDDR